MKVYKETVYFLYAVLLVCTVAFAVQKAYLCLFCVDESVCSVDPLFSDSVKTNIKAFVKDFDGKRVQANAVAHQLQQQFPYARSVVFEKRSLRTVHCLVRGVEPWMRVNDAWIITQEGTVVAQQIFADDVIDGLPHVQIAAFDVAQHNISPFLTSCLEQLPKKIFQTHHVTLVQDHEIKLRDKQQPDFSIICDAASLPDQKVLDACKQIKSDLQKKNRLCSATHWTADVRFENQIVVHKDSGGLCYGKSI